MLLGAFSLLEKGNKTKMKVITSDIKSNTKNIQCSLICNSRKYRYTVKNHEETKTYKLK